MNTVRRLSRHVRLWACGFAVAAIVACTPSAQQQSRTIAAPSEAVDLTPFGSSFAVLAGTAESRGVFLIDASSGNVISSFGVTGEADAISRDSNGSLLLGVSASSGSRNVGAIEFWSPAGKKLHVLPLSDAVAGLTDPVGNHVFALVGSRTVRVAADIDLARSRVARIIPLSASIDHLAACTVNGQSYLLESNTAARQLVIRNLNHGTERAIDEAASDITCAPKTKSLFGLLEAFGSKSLVVQTFPRGLALSQLPASVDALALRVTPSGDNVGILNSAGDRSSIEIIAPPSPAPSLPPEHD